MGQANLYPHCFIAVHVNRLRFTISSPICQKLVRESARVAGMVKEQRRRSERARLIRKMFRGVLITFENKYKYKCKYKYKYKYKGRIVVEV